MTGYDPQIAGEQAMFCAPSTLRRLIISVCVAALTASNLPSMAQAQLIDQKAEIQRAQRIRGDAYRDLRLERRVAAQKIHATMFDYRQDEENALADMNKKMDRKQVEINQEYLAALDRIRGAIETAHSVSSPAPAAAKPAPMVSPTVTQTPDQHDPHKFVSAAEAFVNATKSDPKQAVPAASSADEEFQRHEKWIEEEDRKEHERQAAARREARASAVHVEGMADTTTRSLNTMEKLAGTSDPVERQKIAAEGSDRSPPSRVIYHAAPSSDNGNGSCVDNPSGAGMSCRGQEYLKATVGIMALGAAAYVAATAIRDREIQQMSPEDRAKAIEHMQARAAKQSCLQQYGWDHWGQNTAYGSASDACMFVGED